MALLEELERLEPYAGVSSRASNLLTAIRTAAEAGDLKTIEQSLTHLAQVIVETEQGLEDARHMSLRSILLSVVSVILTVAFGVLSLF